MRDERATGAVLEEEHALVRVRLRLRLRVRLRLRLRLRVRVGVRVRVGRASCCRWKKGAPSP